VASGSGAIDDFKTHRWRWRRMSPTLGDRSMSHWPRSTGALVAALIAGRSSAWEADAVVSPVGEGRGGSSFGQRRSTEAVPKCWYKEARKGMSSQRTWPRSRALRRVSRMRSDAKPCLPAPARRRVRMGADRRRRPAGSGEPRTQVVKGITVEVRQFRGRLRR